MDSPYEVLGIDRGADEEAIERAYRERVKETHPDQGGTREEFQAVRRAYEAIRADAEHEAIADRGGEDGAGTRAGTRNRPWADERGMHSEVTYLDYEVLADFGWDVDDEDLFRKAADAGLGGTDYGQFSVEPGQSVLEAAEDHGLAWPFACRGGACANCAVKVVEGELSMPVSHVLTPELMDRGFRLTCNATPATGDLKVVYNVKHVPDLEELLLPAGRFRRAHSDD